MVRAFTIAMLFGLLFLLLRGTLAAVPAHAALPEALIRPADWKIAVVFKRERGRRIYVGTVSDPVLPSAAVGTATDWPSPVLQHGAMNDRDYEVWLAANGNGARQGFWYSSAQRTFGTLSDRGEPGPARFEDGALQRIVRAARPPVRAAERIDSMGFALYGPPPESLGGLCRRSDLIAVGCVAGVLRSDYTPIGHPNVLQHTVYVVAVETTLKTDSDADPAILKVWQEGGTLPWEVVIANRKGIGSGIEQDPLLNVGDRYLLFLARPDDPHGVLSRRGYVGAVVDGVSGKARELDEYQAAHPWRGKLLLRDGITQPPRVSGKPEYDDWRFRTGPQILGVPEQAAVAAIREQLAR